MCARHLSYLLHRCSTTQLSEAMNKKAKIPVSTRDVTPVAAVDGWRAIFSYPDIPGVVSLPVAYWNVYSSSASELPKTVGVVYLQDGYGPPCFKNASDCVGFIGYAIPEEGLKRFERLKDRFKQKVD